MGKGKSRHNPKSRRPALKPAKFEEFLVARCKPVGDDPTDWVAESTLYAHYRRWAYLNPGGYDRLRPMEKSRFVGLLAKKKRASTKVNGHRLWALGLLADEDVDKERAQYEDRDRERSMTARGRVLITQDLRFVGGVLEKGTVLSWMHANKLERRDIDRMYQRQVSDGVSSPATWLVVMWEDKRRLIPGDAARDVE